MQSALHRSMQHRVGSRPCPSSRGSCQRLAAAQPHAHAQPQHSLKQLQGDLEVTSTSGSHNSQGASSSGRSGSAQLFWARQLLDHIGWVDLDTTTDISSARIAAASSRTGLATLGLAALIVAAGLAAAHPDPASAAEHSQHALSSGGSVTPLFDVSEGEDFFVNVARYGRYFVTVLLGTAYVAVKPLVGLFKRPVTAVFATVGLVGAFLFVKVTLEAMLGTTDALPIFDP